MGARAAGIAVIILAMTTGTTSALHDAQVPATVGLSNNARQLQAAAAPTPTQNIYVTGRLDAAYGDSSWCQRPARSFVTVKTARNTRQKVVAFTPNNYCGIQFFRNNRKYLPLKSYASLRMLLNGGASGGQGPLLFGITDSKGKMYQAPVAGYLPNRKLPKNKWVRVTVPLKAFAGLNPAAVQMLSVWLKGNAKATQTRMYVDGIQLLPTSIQLGTTPTPEPKPTPASTAPPPPAPTAAPIPKTTQRLHTSGNGIYTADGQRWQGRGVNVMDPRMNNQCSPETLAAATAECKRRIDAAVAWGATFLRMPLQTNFTTWDGVLDDGLAPGPSDYRDAIQSIAQHVGRYPGVYMMISIWQDPTFTVSDPPYTQKGWPSEQTNVRWQSLVPYFLGMNQVIFGVVNEPESNDYHNAQAGQYDAACWSAMNAAVAAIRAAEVSAGDFAHLIAVQGTHGWAAVLEYYKAHPITAAGGTNVIYETHMYCHPSDFSTLLTGPAAVLPVVIGEMGPRFEDDDGNLGDPLAQTIPEAVQLMRLAESLDVPWLAWSFSEQCDPSMLLPALPAGQGAYGCHVTTDTLNALQPNEWGSAVKGQLQKQWGK